MTDPIKLIPHKGQALGLLCLDSTTYQPLVGGNNGVRSLISEQHLLIR